MRQVVTLGDLVGRIERLEVRCSRCDRAGRVKLARLIAEHGSTWHAGTGGAARRRLRQGPGRRPGGAVPRRLPDAARIASGQRWRSFSFADRRAGPRTCRCRPGIIQVPPGEQKEATMPEPVTTAILAASAVAGSETVKLAVDEAYAGLRSLARAQAGRQQQRGRKRSPSSRRTPPRPAGRRPQSRSWPKPASTRTRSCGRGEKVMAKLQELPQGERQQIMQAVGSYIAQADRGGRPRPWRPARRYPAPQPTSRDHQGACRQGGGGGVRARRWPRCPRPVPATSHQRVEAWNAGNRRPAP